MADEYWIVCAPEPTLPDSLPAVCSQCGAIVYGTRGTIEKAHREKISIICLRCVKADAKYGGAIHHGRMISDAEAQAIAENWFRRN